jgi:glycosyltransferase involved in cell wall biosynthesis
MRLSYFYDLSVPAPNKAALVQIVNTCHGLAAAGVPTTVLVRDLTTDPAECLAFYGLEPHPDLAIRPLRPGPYWRLRPTSALSRMLAEQRGTGPDVLVSRGLPALRLAPRLPHLRSRGVRFVYEAHRLLFAHWYERQTGQRWDEAAPLSRSLRRMFDRERAVVEGADAVVCVTDGLRDTMTSLFRVTRPVLVLPGGTSVPPEVTSAAAPERDIDVLYVGKLMARKGLANLLAAMRHLPGRRLCVVGGPAEELAACHALVDDEEVRNRIEFTGFVPPARVPDYFARARVGVCPIAPEVSVISQRFTCPLKLLEMMAHGVPAVASDLAVTRAIVTDRESALLVPPSDPVALADGIRTLLEDPALAGRLAEAARRRVLAFTWQERATRLRDFLVEVVGDRELRRSA